MGYVAQVVLERCESRDGLCLILYAGMPYEIVSSASGSSPSIDQRRSCSVARFVSSKWATSESTAPLAMPAIVGAPGQNGMYSPRLARWAGAPRPQRDLNFVPLGPNSYRSMREVDAAPEHTKEP